MTGFLNLLKPTEMSSHSAVRQLRKLLGVSRIGHGGTLDPLACGVLVICVGKATRTLDLFENDVKEYRAEATFGAMTTTDDGEGDILEEKSAEFLRIDQVERCLASLTGRILQVPPAYSAIHVGGRRAYRIARSGQEVTLPPRQVIVHSFRLLDFFGESAKPRALLSISCGSGTYVRSLVRDLGNALGCGAYLSFLVRTRSGPFHLGDSLSLEEVGELVRSGDLARCLISPCDVFPHVPRITLTSRGQTRILHGAPVEAEDLVGSPTSREGEKYFALGAEGDLLALVQRKTGDVFHPLKILGD